MLYTKEINHNLFAMRQADYAERISDTFDNIIHFATREIFEEGKLSSGSHLLSLAAKCLAKRKGLSTKHIEEVLECYKKSCI